MSSSLNSQCFGRCVFRPSLGVSCRTREPARNFRLRPLFSPRGSLVLILLTITGYKYKYSCIATRLQSGLNQRLRPLRCVSCMTDRDELFGFIHLMFLSHDELQLICMIFTSTHITIFFILTFLIIGSHILFISMLGLPNRSCS